MSEQYPINFHFDKKTNLVTIKFNQKKFATKDLGLFANLFYKFLNTKRAYSFHLFNLEWIGHEELVYLSGIFDQLYKNKIEFNIRLRCDSPSLRQIKTIFFLWEKWQIFSFISKNKLLDELHLYFTRQLFEDERNLSSLSGYFNIDKTELIKHYNKSLEIDSENLEISKYFDIDIYYIDRLSEIISEEDNKEWDNYYHQITPFVKLEFIKGKLNERVIKNNLEKIYKLDEKTYNLLEEHSSDTPFLNRTLSTIISKELYENSIEHAFENTRIKNPTCYLSVSLRNKLKESQLLTKDEISNLKEKNFNEEEIFQSQSFFKEEGGFKNQSLIQFTFIDFGEGIPKTLAPCFKQNQNKSEIDDNDILEFSFSYVSSRNPISKKYLEKNYIPRGLFDVISIVSRYRGLIIARSNYGKILFDFSISSKISDCVIKYEEEKKHYFNGTIITIYIPENQFGIETKLIKPQYLFEATKKKSYYLNILAIQKEAIKSISQKHGKNGIINNLYNYTLDKISHFLDSIQNQKCCVFIDFDGFFSDSKLTKKLLFFLSSDYRINEQTNAVITNLEDRDLIMQVQLEILQSPEEDLNYIYHPIPCIIRNSNDLEILWLGVQNKISSENFNLVLKSEIHDRRISDFENLNEISNTGMFHVDEYGNLVTLIGTLRDQSIELLLNKATLNENNKIYLCSGNYYQFEYLALLEHLYDFDYAEYIVNMLYEDVLEKDKDFFSDVTHIMSITLSSQLISNSLYKIDQLVSKKNKKEGLLKSIKPLRLSNYHSYHLESGFLSEIKEGDNIVLVCDVISTGYLIKSLKNKLKQISVGFKGILAIADTRVKHSFNNIPSYYEDKIKTFVLSEYPIQKYSNKGISCFDEKEIVRINPATNTPITLEENKSETEETVLLKNEKFLDLIDNPEEYIEIGYKRYNKLFHPYFFRTHHLFQSKNGIKIIRILLEKISQRGELNIDFIFYPIFSGAEIFQSESYYENVFYKFNCEFIPLSRFETPNGWRFTFPPKFLNTKTINSDIFILDDGSCTGSTIIQMIDEISFLEVKSITLLSVIGRTNDFLREFFSRMKQVKVKYLNDKLVQLFIRQKSPIDEIVPLKIYFGSHWHIPTYPLHSEYPFFEEETRLEYYRNFDNLPDLLRLYINRRIEKIKLSPASNRELTDNLNFLPKNSAGEIPKMDLLNMRNELGKINGYRFYKDYFFNFNKYSKDFLKNDDQKEVYKNTELILAILLHEPYLIQSIQDFLPDVFSCLMIFTEDIIWGKKPKDKKFYYESLYYKWRKASILSTYLNLRKSEPQELFSKQNIEIILKFVASDETENSLRIFLMFILNFIPMSKKELTKQENGIYCLNQISIFINNYEKNEIGRSVLSNLKQYISFLNTIPYLDKELINKKVCLQKLVGFFIDDSKRKYHDSIEMKLGQIKTKCEELDYNQNLFTQIDYIKIIKESWRIILPRIENLLRYSSRVIGFYQVYRNGIIYDDLFNRSYGLNVIVKEINKIILSDKIIENSSVVVDYIKNRLIPNIFTREAFVYKMFTNFTTNNIIDEWDKAMKTIKRLNNTNTDKELEAVKNLTVFFPVYFLSEVLFEEIRKNFRYADINNDILVTWENSDNELTLKLTNNIGKKGVKGGRNGSQLLNFLTDLFDFQIEEFSITDNFFVQKYKFKTE